MKKFIAFIFALVIGAITMVSCSKMETNEYATITLSYTMVESNSMVSTKSVGQSEVNGLIDTCLPTDFEVTLISNESGEEYTAKVGETLTLPIGSYNVHYLSSVPSKPTSTIPTFAINEDNVAITKDTKDCTLKATFECFAVVYDTDIVESIKCNLVQVVDEVRKNGIGLTFVPYRFADRTLNVCTFTLIPKDKVTHKETSITFSTSGEGYHYDFGKYYVLRPMEIETANSSSYIDFPLWGEGNI